MADTATCTITGTHTPPTSGAMTIRNIFLVGTNAIFSSAAAGTATLILIDVAVDVTNGFTFDCVNWTSPGGFVGFDIGEIGSTNDGWVNNTGGAAVFMTNITMGAGTGQTMVTSGAVELYGCVVGCPSDFQTGTDAFIGATYFQQPVTSIKMRVAIFSSAAAGTATLILIDVAVDVTNGFTFDCVNWTSPGGFVGFDIGEIGSTNDGWVNNTGGAAVFMTNITMGAGS